MLGVALRVAVGTSCCYSPSHPIPNPTDCNHAVRLIATTPIIFGPVAFFVYGDCEVSLMRLWHQPTPPGQPQQLHPTPLQQQMPFPTDAAFHPQIVRKAISTAWRIQTKCRPEMGYTFFEHLPMVYIDSATLFGIHFMRAFRGSEDLMGEG
jgi:hypothetical protein